LVLVVSLLGRVPPAEQVAAPSRAVESNAVVAAIMSTSIGFPADSSMRAWKR
jgi:hypothetical protein